MAVEGGGIGARLRSGREKLGLTVLQVSERLHTDSRIVDALEADDLAALGAPVYARGHIRHYAELVGESATDLLAIYANINKVAQPDLTQIAKVPQSDNSSKLVAPALLVIAVFAVAGAVWWISALSKKEPRLSETHVVGSSDAAAVGQGSAVGDGVAAGADATGQGVTGGEADAGATAANGPAMRSASPNPGTRAAPTTASVGGPSANAKSSQNANANASPKPGQTATANANANPRAGQPLAANARSAAAAAAQPPSSGSKGAASAAAAAAPPAASPTAVAANAAAPHSKHDTTITLRYSADSWTEVYDASGQRLFYDVGAANTVQNFTGTYPLRVVLGNASGVSVEFNGHNAPIANLLHPDGSAQFSINRSGRVVRARSVADGG